METLVSLLHCDQIRATGELLAAFLFHQLHVKLQLNQQEMR